jgi:ATP-binding cassette subfamily B protein
MSIGMVLPFLAAITNPHQFINSEVGMFFTNIIPGVSKNAVIIPVTVVFCFAALFSGLIRLSLLWATTRISYATGADLSLDIYRKTLYQPYSVHISRNSSEIISAISNKTNAIINNALYPILAISSSSVLLIAILIALISINPVVACGLFFGFGLIYVVIIRATYRQLRLNSEAIAGESTKVIKALQEGLGGIRDVLIDSSQELYCKIYRQSDLAFRRAQGSNQFVAASPRFFIEALGMVLIAIFAGFVASNSVTSDIAIPLLGTLAVGAVRLLPLLQQIFASWTSLVSGQSSVIDALTLLDQPLNTNFSIKKQTLDFSKSIEFEGISFSHNQGKEFILKNISLCIKKGEVIGFMGPSGSGKSTLLDIAMGLIMPSKGILKIDGETISKSNSSNWQKNIAHVPQNIFLSDVSIAENIAFGIPADLIDFTRMRDVIELAQMTEVISALPKGCQTQIGERGILLSGGQRQRLGIARALYKDSKVLILDEATSALDGKTENDFMTALVRSNKDVTIIMVAHRLSTLKACDRIYELVDGEIRSFGSYNNLL